MGQMALALELGLNTYQAISHVELGRRTLPANRLALAARRLHVSADWLLGLTDDHRPAAEISLLLAECRGSRSIPIIGEVAAGYPTRWRGRGSKPREGTDE